nr:uroporphyrinogen decarboxylase family protein [uncultured Holophaga sp.]
MTTSAERCAEKLARVRKVVALEKVDRVPVAALATSFCANHVGVKMSEFCVQPELMTRTMIKSFGLLGDIDAIQQPTFSAHVLSLAWLSKVKIPGRDMAEDQPWQVAEAELMTLADYDTIIEKGYNAFFGEYQASRLDNLMPKLVPMFEWMPGAIKLWEDSGTPVLSPFQANMPYEYFCGGRTMPRFMRDLFSMPDKVQEAMDAAMPDLVETARQTARGLKPFGAWVGGWRSASEFINPKTWKRFVWPYMKKMADTLLEEGVTPIFHLDSNWERDLEHFLEMPKGKCILSPDHATDIFAIKRILGGHMAIMGDVPAALFALGTPDKVRDYCKRLLGEIGPEGLILSSGCDIPFNGKPENVAAMIESVHR